MTDMTRIEKKLTIATLGLNVADLVEGMKVGETQTVARMYGRADKYKVAPSRFDPTKEDVRFFGEFEGVNLINGEVTNAPACYLPGAASDVLRQGVDAADGDSVLFGAIIAVTKTEKKSATDKGYKFSVQVPKQPTTDDPLALIRDQMGAVQPLKIAPPAPKADKKAKSE